MASQVFWKGFGLSTSASGGNTGAILINPNFLALSSAYEFLNLMKVAQFGWIHIDNNTQLTTPELDSNGYPVTSAVTGSGVYMNVLFPPVTSNRPNPYVLTFTGNGTVNVNGATLTSGSWTGSGGVGHAEFNIASAGGLIQVQITAAPVTNMVLYNKADATDIGNGLVSGKQFRFRMKQGQIPVFRSLNWVGGGSDGGANITNLTDWASRKPSSYVSYVMDEFRGSEYYGTTTNSGNDYSVGPSSSGAIGTQTTLTDKMRVSCIINSSQVSYDTSFGSKATASGYIDFTTGASGTLTWTPSGGGGHGLSVGDAIVFGGFNSPNFPTSSGSLPILTQWGIYYVVSVPTSTTFTISATPGGTTITWTGTASNVVASRAATLNFNSTGKHPIIGDDMAMIWGNTNNTPFAGSNNMMQAPASGFWGQYAFTYDAGLACWVQQGSGGVANGVPPEVFVQMCAECGMHPWFVAPYFACDPMTDWHLQLARYIKNNGPSWMIPRFECINEPWNTQNTGSGGYPPRKAWNNWNTTSVQDAIGKIASTIGQDIVLVYGNPSGSNCILCSNIITGGNDGPYGPEYDPYLTSAAYVAQSAAAQGPTSWNPSGYTKTAAYHYLTHLCNNQYFGSDGSFTTADSQWAAAGAGAPKQAVIDGYLALGDLFLTPAATTTGSISGSTLTVSSGTGIAIGQTVSDWPLTGVAQNTKITAGSGTSWTVSPGGQSVGSRTLIFGLNNGFTGTAADAFGGAAGMRVTTSALFTLINGLGFTNNAGKTIGVCGYEGGFNVGLGSDNLFSQACRYGTNVQSYVQTVFQNYMTDGGVFPAEFHLGTAQFAVGNTFDLIWAVFDKNDVYQTPDPPKWAAIVSFS